MSWTFSRLPPYNVLLPDDDGLTIGERLGMVVVGEVWVSEGSTPCARLSPSKY